MGSTRLVTPARHHLGLQLHHRLEAAACSCSNSKGVAPLELMPGRVKSPCACGQGHDAGGVAQAGRAFSPEVAKPERSSSLCSVGRVSGSSARGEVRSCCQTADLLCSFAAGARPSAYSAGLKAHPVPCRCPASARSTKAQRDRLASRSGKLPMMIARRTQLVLHDQLAISLLSNQPSNNGSAC